MSKVIDKIAKAKANLVLDQPFFASLLLPMPIIEDNSVPTMATDGDSILYNAKWTDSLTLSELLFVLAHETMHCVFMHMTRREDRTPNRWNQAADYVINDLLVKERLGTMPDGGLLDPKLVAKGDGTAEGVYKLLPESRESKKAGQKGGAMDEVRDAGSNPKVDEDGNQIEGSGHPISDASGKSEKEAEMRVRVTQARNAAKMQGKLSAGLERLVGELIKTKTDWRAVLRRFISERAKSDLSFAKPKRRWLGEDMILPSLVGEKLGKIVIAVDCSGSVDEELLGKFNAEINAILEDTAPTEIKVLYFDAKVLRVNTFETAPIQLEAIGGGGTAFAPIFKAVNKFEEAPIACIVLTDMYCDDFGKCPSYPVLWASTTNIDTAPFGEVVSIKE